MIRVRVDDFPQTKGEPQHTLQAFREFHRELSALLGGKRYLLGVIPRRCTAEDVLMLRNETDCVIGMHGIHHSENMLDLYQNEFPPYLSRQNVGRLLMEASDALEQAVGREVRIYMPPRNRIDGRTVSVLLECGFFGFTSGPETPEEIRNAKRDVSGIDPICIHSQPPYEYGRTDELLACDAHLRMMEKSDRGHDVCLTLHWTWETNIGLGHMRTFLSQIPPKYFEDFDA